MKKLKYTLALALLLGLGGMAQAQSSQEDAPETTYQSTPKPDPIDLDSPPPLGLLSSGETKLEEVSIYPNPGDGLLRIKLGDQNQGGRIQVFDIAGRVYFDSEIDPLAKTDPVVDLRPLPDGVYVVRVGNHMKKYRKI